MQKRPFSKPFNRSQRKKCSADRGEASVNNATHARRVYPSCRLDNDFNECHSYFVVLDKYEKLRALISGYESCIVAYSGGVDSVFLAWVARHVLGDRSLAVIADSPSLPRRELEEALAIAERFQIPV